MGKWTKGKWRLEGPDDFGDYTIKEPDSECAIAAVVNGSIRDLCGSSDEQQANARLMTTAPELYEQVELFEQSLVYEIKKSENQGDEEGARLKTVTLNIVRDVLARANGEGE